MLCIFLELIKNGKLKKLNGLFYGAEYVYSMSGIRIFTVKNGEDLFFPF